MTRSYIKNAVRCAKYHCKWSGIDYDELLSFAFDYIMQNKDINQLWFKVRLRALSILQKQNRRNRLAPGGANRQIVELTMSEYSRSAASQRRTCLEDRLWLTVFNAIQNGNALDMDKTDIDILKMYYLGGNSQTEIAKKLKLSNSVISRRIAKSHSKLTERLTGNCF